MTLVQGQTMCVLRMPALPWTHWSMDHWSTWMELQCWNVNIRLGQLHLSVVPKMAFNFLETVTIRCCDRYKKNKKLEVRVLWYLWKSIMHLSHPGSLSLVSLSLSVYFHIYGPTPDVTLHHKKYSSQRNMLLRYQCGRASPWSLSPHSPHLQICAD